MTKSQDVKDVVKEAQSKWRFTSHAKKDLKTGELYLGTDEFINIIAPPSEDYHKIQREQYRVLFRVADRQGKGKINQADWVYFENLLNKPDAEYEIAFRLFDVERLGYVEFEEFRRVYELNKGPNSIPFNWNCEWARLYLGGAKKHKLDYPQFCQMLRGLLGERIRQAFITLDKDGDGYIEPEEFERIIRETSRHKLSDHVLEHLSTLCNVSQGSKVSYANVRAFQNMIKDVNPVGLIIRAACAKTKDKRITRDEFLNQAAKMMHESFYTPMEADILFHFASIDEPSGRLALVDFAKVLDPSWRVKSEEVGVGGAAVDAAKSTTANVFGQVLESGYNFILGSMAGAFGAFMVYPIDLVKTRMQNQRGVQPGQQLYNNSIDCFKKVVRNEGALGLYSGVLPQLVGVAPEKAIKLTVNDLVRGWFTDKKTGKMPLSAEILAGGSAGACQVVFTNPLEIVKIRLQVQGEAVKKGAQATPKRSAMWIIRNLGLVGLYKGATACLARDVPFSAIYFPTYAHLKSGMFHESPTHKLGIFQLLTAGAIAGMPAAYFTTPFDVIKTRLQVEARKGETSYNGLTHAAKTIYKEEGFRAFFKGGPARILRSSPQFGFTLAAYEVLQSSLPYPGKSSKSSSSPTINDAVSKLRQADSSPFARSRNALRLILDIDQDFGRNKLADASAWTKVPSLMGGKAQAAAAQ